MQSGWRTFIGIYIYYIYIIYICSRTLIDIFIQLFYLASGRRGPFVSSSIGDYYSVCLRIFRDDWVVSAVFIQVLFISFCLFLLLSLLLSPTGAAVVAVLLLVHALFVGGLLSLLSVPFDVVTLIVSKQQQLAIIETQLAS